MRNDGLLPLARSTLGMVCLFHSLTPLVAPEPSALPHAFKQDCMQLVKRARVPLLSCSLSLFLLSSSQTKLVPSSLSGPSFLFILTTFSLVMSSGSYTIWIVRKLQMFFVSIPMSIALQVWFSFLFLFLFSN